MSFDSEVVIIGSGPVGSTIAYYLSQKNLDVTLIDKSEITRGILNLDDAGSEFSALAFASVSEAEFLTRQS